MNLTKRSLLLSLRRLYCRLFGHGAADLRPYTASTYAKPPSGQVQRLHVTEEVPVCSRCGAAFRKHVISLLTAPEGWIVGPQGQIEYSNIPSPYIPTKP